MYLPAFIKSGYNLKTIYKQRHKTTTIVLNCLAHTVLYMHMVESPRMPVCLFHLTQAKGQLRKATHFIR